MFKKIAYAFKFGKFLNKKIYEIHYLNRLNVAISRATIVAQLRKIDEQDPASWEFSGFSQNGEDGILDFLSRKIQNPNHYFIEIGAADGLENNTAWFAFVRKYTGLMIEGSRDSAAVAQRVAALFNPMCKVLCQFVTPSNVSEITKTFLYNNPDIFSLDIDGVDYYIARALLRTGFKPKIIIVEYNSTFGPAAAMTVEEKDNFSFMDEHPSGLYYGVSVCGWRKLFEPLGYRFITVDQKGVNAVFVDETQFDSTFLRCLKGVDFRENVAQQITFRCNWVEQFNKIKNKNVVKLS